MFFFFYLGSPILAASMAAEYFLHAASFSRSFFRLWAVFSSIKVIIWASSDWSVYEKVQQEKMSTETVHANSKYLTEKASCFFCNSANSSLRSITSSSKASSSVIFLALYLSIFAKTFSRLSTALGKRWVTILDLDSRSPSSSRFLVSVSSLALSFAAMSRRSWRISVRRDL